MNRRQFFGIASQAALVCAIPAGIAGAMLTADPKTYIAIDPCGERDHSAVLMSDGDGNVTWTNLPPHDDHVEQLPDWMYNKLAKSYDDALIKAMVNSTGA